MPFWTHDFEHSAKKKKRDAVHANRGNGGYVLFIVSLVP
jgi:hypothetical protein